MRGICFKNHKEISKQYISNYLKPFATNYDDYYALMEHDLNDIISLSILILNLGNLTRNFHIEDDHIFHGGSKSVCPVMELEDEKIMDSNIYKQAEIEFRSA